MDWGVNDSLKARSYGQDNDVGKMRGAGIADKRINNGNNDASGQHFPK